MRKYGKGNAKRLKKHGKYVTVISFVFAFTVWPDSIAA